MNSKNPFVRPAVALGITGGFLVVIALTRDPQAAIVFALLGAAAVFLLAIMANIWNAKRATPLSDGESVVLRSRAAVGVDWCWLTVTNERVICEPHWAAVLQSGTQGVNWHIRMYEITGLERDRQRGLILRATDILVIRTRQGERRVSGPQLDDIAHCDQHHEGSPGGGLP